MIDRSNFSIIGIVLGLIIFSLFLFSPPADGISKTGWITAGVALLMTVWWISEAVPIYITGIIPLIIFPLTDVFKIKTVATSYSHPLVLLFLGGFIIASALEKTGLHKRIALRILKFFGTSQSNILAGFMFTTALLSMWVSNTASTIMMLPIAMSVIVIFNKEVKVVNSKNEFSKALLLSIAYSASIGGTATLIGTPTNIMLVSILNDTYGYEISFAQWLKIGLPIVIILIPISWLYLSNIIFKLSNKSSNEVDKIIIKLNKQLGKASFAEKVVAFIFILTASLWILRRKINQEFNLDLNDTSIGLLGALLLFMIPINKKERSINWETASKIPWGVLLLVGGGISLSSAIKSSGLGEWIGSFSFLFNDLNPYLLILFSLVLIVFLTELNSNTATVATFIPILIVLTVDLNYNPLFFIIPVTIAASCAFMLPIATPPNAVIFGSGKIKIQDMVVTGFFLNIIAISVVGAISLVIFNILGYQLDVRPEWIN